MSTSNYNITNGDGSITYSGMTPEAAYARAQDLAVKHLDATRYCADTVFTYADANTPDTVYLVDAADMADLGARLARGDGDAYSHWCADTSTESVTAERIVSDWQGAGSTLADVKALGSAAAAHGDMLTVAACDHLAERICDLLAARKFNTNRTTIEAKVVEGLEALDSLADALAMFEVDGQPSEPRPRIRLSARIGTAHADDGSARLGPQRHGVRLFVTDVTADRVLARECVSVVDEAKVVEVAKRLIAEHGVTEQRDTRLAAMGIPLMG